MPDTVPEPPGKRQWSFLNGAVVRFKTAGHFRVELHLPTVLNNQIVRINSVGEPPRAV
jgi:hypothetical protein